MELKGSKTEKNLLEAFAGESMAHSKYTYYANKARKDGYQQIAAIFEETAGNEMAHAKQWFRYICGGGKRARRALPQTACKRGGRNRILQGRGHDVAVQKMRFYPFRQESAGKVSGLRA